jgi:hypothetical protein
MNKMKILPFYRIINIFSFVREEAQAPEKLDSIRLVMGKLTLCRS